VKHHTPHLDGKPVDLIIAASNWWGRQLGNGYTEQNQLECLNLHIKNDLNINCWWIDAGWFEGGWPSGVGNWFPSKDRFPDELKLISKAAHDAGMKFLLWFEPERVAETSQIYREHPEWTLAAPEGAQKRGEVYCPDIHGPTNYLFDMGNPEARKWLTDHIAKMIEEKNIDIYRHDANIDPMNFWPTNEDPERVGIREIRYIEGLYEFWEELKRRKPGLIVECCCSGNRRFDLETISRTVNLWRSDYFREPHCNQAQTYGLSQYVVLHGLGTVSEDKYIYRSLLGPSMVIEWPVDKQDFDFELGRDNIELFYKTRELFYGDYYPLTPYSVKQNVWLAYQFHREDLGRGVVFAFRRPECEDSGLMVQLGGLSPDTLYQVENVDTKQKAMYSGSKLAAGLKVQSQTKPEAVVFLYRQIN
jgi:alpha-galactosidase